jgi:hypothetical protein
MIAHNRGWGVQLEDALFVDQMTGHYRFRGLSTVAVAALPRNAVAAAVKRPLTRVAEAGRPGAGRTAAVRSPVAASGDGAVAQLLTPPMGLGLAGVTATPRAAAARCEVAPRAASAPACRLPTVPPSAHP